MKRIDLGDGGFLEPERPEDRHTPFHKRIVSTSKIPNTRVGHYAELECGHRAMLFGDLALADGVALCMQCRDASKGGGS